MRDKTESTGGEEGTETGEGASAKPSPEEPVLASGELNGHDHTYGTEHCLICTLAGIDRLRGLLDRERSDSLVAHRWFAAQFGDAYNGRDFAVKCAMADRELAQLRADCREALAKAHGKNGPFDTPALPPRKTEQSGEEFSEGGKE